MTRREQFLHKCDTIMKTKDGLRLLILVIKKPWVPFETIMTTECISDEVNYIERNYDSDLKSFVNPECEILDYIVL
jgi:hypothetical protein